VSEALIGGGVGGVLAAAVAHVVTSLFDKAGHSAAWLQGRYGPPFFNVALFMGVFYGGIAFSLSRRKSDAAVGALGPLLGIALPMAFLTHMLSIPEGARGIIPGSPSPWVDIVTLIFVAAVWGTVTALGWRLGGGWRGALGAVLGSFAGYLILSGAAYATPALMRWPVPLHDYLPTPAVLFDGLLTGAGIGAGALLFRRNRNA
jgi:hypothetical protein